MVKIKPLGKGFMIFLVFLLGMSWASFSFAATQQELQDAIKKLNEERQQIDNQILETQKQLETTQQTGSTLKKTITSIDKQVSQLNLNIKSSEITIKKLNLEIDSLQYDITDTEVKVYSKKEAIGEILRQLQQTSGDTPLTVFLKGDQLTDSFFEFQSLKDLNKNLTDNVVQLNVLENQLNDALQDATNKNQQKKSENKTLKNKKFITEDLKQEKQTLLQQTKNQEKTYQQQLSELEKLQAEISAEIGEAEKALRLKIDPSILPIPRAGVLEMPVQGKLTQGYGATSFALRTYKSKWHNGVDYGAPIGTPVLAAEKGTVIFVSDQDKYCYRGAYGKVIVIKHENNLITLYGHLSLYVVKIGDSVQRGQLIGYVGKTGYVTGPHLHFSVYAGQTFYVKQSKFCGPMPVGGDLNPLSYL